MKTLIILPTYNEKENIGTVLVQIVQSEAQLEALVVDDNSPDGTAEVVRSLIGPKVHLLVREAGKGGRGGAVRTGFAWAQSRSYDVIFEMDSDRSHRVEEVPLAIALIQPHVNAATPAVVVGSRYAKGGSISGWPIHRRVFSRLANLWARALLGVPVSDFTNGFRAYNRAAIEAILSAPQKFTGFIYLSECLALLASRSAKIQEFPVHWINRTHGHSTVGFQEIKQAFLGIIDVAAHYRKMERPK